MNASKKIVIVFLSLVYFAAFSQNRIIDSLKASLKTQGNDTVKVNTLNALSNTYIGSINDVKAAKHYADQSLVLAKQLNFKKGIAYSYFYFGIYYWRTGDYSISLSYFKNALLIFSKINYQKGIALVNVNMGPVYNSQGNYAEALICLMKGIKIKEELAVKNDIFGAYNALGVTYACQAKYPQAYAYFLKSLKEDINDKATATMTYNNIGYMFSQQEKLNEALIYYFKAIPLQKEMNDKLGISITYTNVGTIYYSQKKYKEALKYHSMTLQLSKETGDKWIEAFAYSGIGLVYTAQKKYIEAIAYQLKALKIQKAIVDKEGGSATCMALGIIYEKKQNDAKAIQYYLEALAMSKSIGLKEGIKNAYKSLSEVHTKIKDYEQALHYTTLYYTQKDSILNKDVLKQVAELNTKYETEKKEKEIQLLTKDQELNTKTLKQQKMVRLALIIGLTLLGILLFTVYQRYRFKQKANLLLEKQKKEIQEQHLLITDSIDYAKTIQDALLPNDTRIKELFPESFIFFKPKDIVSGDFYWIREKDNKIICIVADCTGHGVPGAFMALLGINILDDIINKVQVHAASILTKLNTEITFTLSQQNANTLNINHGMDIAILIVDKYTMEAQYAGAHNSLYFIRNGQFNELKADKMGIGTATVATTPTLFTNHVLELEKGDVFYLFTDGFPDQIGGPNKKKFYYPPFKKMLVHIHQIDMNQQKNILNKTITEWRGEREQMDDILIMGIKI